MKNLKSKFIIIVSIIIVLSSCVSQKKYKELEEKNKICNEELNNFKSKNDNLNNQVTELITQIAKTKEQVENLKLDTSNLGKESRNLNEKYNELNKSYEEIVVSNQKLMTGNKAEISKMLANIQKLQEDIQKRDDALRNIENDNIKKKAELEKLERELKKKEQNLNELQAILDQKDEAVKTLKNKVSKALMGFEKSGLNVQQKNGKVYVSLEDKLLFESGSFEINKEGENALKELSKILEQDKDINIMIEGHTDDVPYTAKSSQIKDNWDLSVMRATTIVKTLLKNSKIDPKRLTASGKGEFLPLDNSKTKESRQKNRRTEIILTPKLDELFKILE